MDVHAGGAGARLLVEVGDSSGTMAFEELYRRDFTAVVGLVYALSGMRRRSAEARTLLRLSGQRARPEPLPDDAEAFWRAVRRLPIRQAQAIALHYLEDRSVKDIAAVLECAEATVRVHLHRGRQALAAALGEKA